MPKPISKSQFNLAQQCGKAFYLYRHKKDLLKHSEGQLQVMQQGTDFGELMQQRYPGGVDVSYEEDFSRRIALTNVLLEQADHPIYEATLTAEVAGARLLCMVDIMVPTTQGWHLIEVKSGGRLKDPYVADANFQCFVAQEKGVEVARLSVLHVNTNYVRQGDLDISAIGTLVDLDLADVPDFTEELEELLVVDAGEEPQIEIGGHCHSPYSCGFIDHCWSHFPKKDNVFKLLSGKKAIEQVESGIYKLDDVDPDVFTGRVVERYDAWRNNEWIWNQARVDEFLAQAQYPLYYLDFETFMTSVPPYDNVKPYQQVCFQYSLHIQQEEGGEVEHKEFLARPEEGEPRRPFVESLLENIGTSGSIMVYNATFERTRLKELGVLFPEYLDRIQNCNTRMLDLLIPFRSLWIYHPDMGNSASLKVVLPALVPELSYNDMEVADGGMAINAYLELMHSTTLSDEDRMEKRKALLEYCKLDTWAMFKLLERMRLGISEKVFEILSRK